MKCRLLLCVVVHLVGMASCAAAGHGGVIGAVGGKQGLRAQAGLDGQRAAYGARSPVKRSAGLAHPQPGTGFSVMAAVVGPSVRTGRWQHRQPPVGMSWRPGAGAVFLQQAERSRGFVAGAMGQAAAGARGSLGLGYASGRGRGRGRAKIYYGPDEFDDSWWTPPPPIGPDPFMQGYSSHVYPRQQFGYGAMPHGVGTAHHFWGGVVISQAQLPGEDEASLLESGGSPAMPPPPPGWLGWGCASQEWVQTCRCRRRTITRLPLQGVESAKDPPPMTAAAR